MRKRKKKSNLQKRKENENSTYWGTKALKLWREICLLKFNNKCLICNTTEQLEAHHPISKKTCKSLTYNTTNQILLCSKHHNWFGTEEHTFSAHKAPLQFYDYLKEHYPNIYFDIWAIDIEAEKQKEFTTKEYYEELEKVKKGLETTG